MLRPPLPSHRRAHSDTQDVSTTLDVTQSTTGHGSDGQLELTRTPTLKSTRKPVGGTVVVRTQMKQVVGDLVSVLGDLKTVVGDIRSLVSQIDVVTTKLDNSISSDQSEKSIVACSILESKSDYSQDKNTDSSGKVNPRRHSSSAHKSDSSDERILRSKPKASRDCSGEDVIFMQTSTGRKPSNANARRMAKMCHFSCLNVRTDSQTDGYDVQNIPDSRISSQTGERLSNHETVYLAYRPDAKPKHQRPLSIPVSENYDNYIRFNRKGNESKRNSKPYKVHIYENIQDFSPRRNSIPPQHKFHNRSANIPLRTDRNGNSINQCYNKYDKPVDKTSGKCVRKVNYLCGRDRKEYSGMYEREMEERLELEFDESLDLLDTLAEIQSVDDEFDQGFEDCDIELARDQYPVDMVRKHADVVAWAQSAWPGARLLGNSLDQSDPEEDTDSDWYEPPPVIPKSVNPYLKDFTWRTLIET